ncbi:MAG TPA: BON domain-containing protein [Gemmatimonas sp.]|uniref:BON domain-containing protein n=1 Tax=Gemmatimonas sp. TaxID=1962908 RepID=UPI002EDB1B97
MAREQHTRYPNREQYRGEDYNNQRYQQGRERDAWYGAEEARMRDDRHWQQGPDDWNSPYSSRQSMDEGMYNDRPSSRDRGETYRSRGNAEWEPYDRGPSRYRNGVSNQADGYGQDQDRYQGGRTVAPTNGYNRGQNGPYNGQYADRSNGYGDTRSDNYGGGGYNGGANADRGRNGYSARQQENDHRTDAPYYGSEFIQDMERGRSDSRYAQRGDGFDSQSNFSGRGPKGWKRSDERIQEELNEQLERHSAIDASEIEVKVQSGEVTLSGTTSDRRMKRMAEDIAENVAGVREVQNQIRLQRADGANGSADRKQQSDDSKQAKQRTGMTS